MQDEEFKEMLAIHQQEWKTFNTNYIELRDVSVKKKK